MIALNYGKTESHPERVLIIKPLINKCNWDGIKHPSKTDGWKTFENNNPTIALNFLYTKEMKKCPAYFSKIHSNCENQIILLMIPNKEREGWHYLAIKKLSALVKRITAKHNGDFYCLNHIHSFRAENKLKSHEKVCKNKDFCAIAMPSPKDNILPFNQYMSQIKCHTLFMLTLNLWLKKQIDVQKNLRQ